MATFKWVADAGQFGWTARDSSAGVEVVRHGLVDTDDPGLALFVPGLPRVGDAYSPLLPGVVVSDVLVDRLGGTPNGLGDFGSCRVRVAYAFPRLASSGPALPPGQAYTDLGGSQVVDTTYATLDGQTIPNGVAVEAGRLDAAVHAFVLPTGVVDIPRLVALMLPSKVNDAAMVLPPILGGANSLAMDVGQVRYKGFALHARTNALEIVHQLSLAPDHLSYWRYFDASGQAGPESAGPVYPPASFGGLW